jgi:hypothetical protein
MHSHLTAALAEQRRHDRDRAAALAARHARQSAHLLPRVRVTWTRTTLAGRSWVLVISATRAA